jgi:hypothetical protein
MIDWWLTFFLGFVLPSACIASGVEIDAEDECVVEQDVAEPCPD